MALVNLMNKVSLSHSTYLSNPLIFKNLLQPVRNYMKNFFNEETKIKPVRGWMHQNREIGAGNRTKKLQLSIMRYSEIKRQR